MHSSFQSNDHDAHGIHSSTTNIADASHRNNSTLWAATHYRKSDGNLYTVRFLERAVGIPTGVWTSPEDWGVVHNYDDIAVTLEEYGADATAMQVFKIIDASLNAGTFQNITAEVTAEWLDRLVNAACEGDRPDVPPMLHAAFTARAKAEPACADLVADMFADDEHVNAAWRGFLASSAIAAE